MESSPDHIRVRLARGMLWASLGILFYIRTVSGIDGGFTRLGVLLAMASYPPLMAILTLRRSSTLRYGLLAGVVLLYLLPFPIVGLRWSWMPWTVAAAVLVVLPARWAWPAFIALVGATGAGAWLLHDHLYLATWFESTQYMTITADDGLIVFSVAALVATVERLCGARDELARLALIRERLRLDGELRVVVGGKLEAIAFRLRRAARVDVPEAREEVYAATELARETMAEVRATADAYRVDAAPALSAPVESARLARRVLLAVLLIQCTLVLTNYVYAHRYMMQPASPVKTALLLCGLAAVVVLRVIPPTRTVLVLQSLVILLPLLLFPDEWDRLLCFFTGTVLLRLRPPWSWLIATGTLAAHLGYLLYGPLSSVPNDLVVFGGHLMLMWLVYSLGRLTDLTAALDRARHELAVTTVRRERARIARDLHDVLGYRFSAVALKGEVAQRLLDTMPQRARTEIAELAAATERAVAELEAIVEGRVELDVRTEIDTAVRTLESAGIAAVAHVRIPSLPVGADTALAAVLRESVTNVLRHSQARSCTITISETVGGARLSVTNDGAIIGPAPVVAERSGSGLSNLAQRTGGRLIARHRSGDRFEVIGELSSDPTGFVGDPDGIDPVAGGQLGDGGTQVVANGAVGQE